MIKKIRSGEVIKDLHLDESFVVDNDFYIPVNINSDNAKILNARFLLLTFTPEFILEINTPEIGRSTRTKPLFIKNFTKNKKKFSEEDVEDDSTTNSFFKKIYSSNIVSSYSNKDYIDNLTPIDFVYNEEESNVKVTTKSSVLDIKNTTPIIYGQFQKFYLNVYVLNNNFEVLDFSSVLSTKSINEYPVIESQVNENIMQNSLNIFSDFFNFLFLPYTFPIKERLLNEESIRGINYRINEQENNMLDTNVLDNVSVFFQSEELNKSYLIRKFEEDNLVNEESFSTRLIQSNSFFNFINNCYQFYKSKLIASDQINFKLLFEGKKNSNIMTVKKDFLVSFNSLKKAYEDLLRFRLENNIVQGRMINISINKLNSLGSSDSQINTYSVTLSLNDLALNADFFNSSFNLEFFDIENEKIRNIQTLYFDDSLTDGNGISLLNNRILISDIMLNSNTITLYFDCLKAVKEGYLLFYYNNETDFIRIGPAISQESIYSFNRVAKNIFEEASLTIARLINQKSFNTVDVREYILGNRSNFDDLEIQTSNLIENINFKNLNYFILNSSLESNSVENQINNVLQNILVKVNKKIIISNIEIANSSHYCALSDITNTNLNNIINADVFTYPSITNNTDYRSSLANRTDIFSSLNSFLLLQGINSINEAFKAEVCTSFSFIVMKNNIVTNFGRQDYSRDSKVEFIDYIIESNPNYSSEDLNNLLNKAFSDQYFSLKQTIIREIFSLSNKKNVDFVFNKTIRKNDILNLVNDSNLENNPITFENVNFNEYDKNSSMQIRNNAIIDINRSTFLNDTNLSFVLTKKIFNSPNFVFFGDKIRDIIEQKNLGNINYIAAKATINYQIDQRTNIDVSRIEGLDSYRSSDCVYISVIEPAVIDLETVIGESTIEASVTQNNFIFSHINRDFYQIVSSVIQSQQNPKKLIIKNIIVRICLEFDYFDNVISLSKNIVLKPSENFNNYLSQNSVVRENNKLNLDLLDQNKDHFMPVVFYKDQVQNRPRIGRI